MFSRIAFFISLLITQYSIPANAQVLNSTGGKITISGGAMTVKGKMLMDTASVIQNSATLKTDSLKNAGDIRLTGNAAQMIIDSGMILQKGVLQLNSNKLVLLNGDTNALQVTEGKLIAEDSLWGKVVWHIGENTGKYKVPFVNDSLQDVGIELSVIDIGNGENGIIEFSTYKTQSDNFPKPYELLRYPFASAGVDSHALKIADRYWFINAAQYTQNPVSEITLKYDSSELNGTEDSLIISRLGNKCWKDWTHLSGTLNATQRKFQTDSLSKYDVLILHKPVNWAVAGTTSHYAKPVSPAPQLVSSDTAYMFIFSDITAKYWGNQIEWAFDSSFSGSQIEASPHDITVTVAPMEDTLLWLRSRDSTSGCYTEAVTTIAIVDTMQPQEPPTDTFDAVCAGFSKTIDIADSDAGLEYFLRIHATTVDSGIGNDSVLHLNTGIIDTTTVFNILTVDTATGDTTIIDLSYVIRAIDSVGTPVFIEGDTFVHVDDSICYFAAAENSTSLIYKIHSGSADIDSLTGCISNVTSDFTIRAVAKGLPSCGTKTNDYSVTITEIAAPEPPEAQYAVVDTQQKLEFVFDSIYAGAGGNQIEWAFNPDFDDSEILASPATISFYLDAGKDTAIYLRSRHNETGKVSKTKRTGARLAYPLLSAGLLDKSQWELQSDLSDEFNYNTSLTPTLPAAHPDFQLKWALNYCDDPGCLSANCDNHVHGVTERQYYNFSNDDIGSSGEVSFVNGMVRLAATKLTTPFIPTCTPNRSFTYRSGMLGSKEHYSVATPALFEIRCKMPGTGAWPAFWIFSGVTEFDIFDDSRWLSEAPNNHRTQSGGIDATRASTGDTDCGQQFFKLTPCDYTEDWHTFSLLVSDDQIIFFVDGKETWSIFLDAQDPFPAQLPNLLRLYINLAVLDDVEDTYEYLVDYVRYYQPRNNPSIRPPTLQNLQNDVPLTLENPNANTTNYNLPKKASYYTVSPYSRIATIGSGNDVKVFHQNKANPNVAYVSFISNNDWTEQRVITSGIGNVKDFLTAVNEDLVYYQGTGNELMYLKKDNNTWTVHQAFDHIYQGNYIANCAGYISVTSTGLVYYKGTDHHLWVWEPGARKWKISLDSPGGLGAPVVVNKSGTLAFYVDNQYNLRQLYLPNVVLTSWQKIPTPVVDLPGNLTFHLELDEINSCIFFIATSAPLQRSLYYYPWNFNSANPAGVVKLGNHNVPPFHQNNDFVCADYYNICADCNLVNSYLTLNHDKNILFVKERDEKVWYYFNDGEQSFDADGNEISRENWNKTPLDYFGDLVSGPIAVESESLGKLFYVSKTDGYLYAVDWVNADYPLVCPESHLGPEYGAYKISNADDTSSNWNNGEIIFGDTTNELEVVVYPNPSENAVTIIIDNLIENSTVQIAIEDLNGKCIYKANEVMAGGKYAHEWNTAGIQKGFYFYKILINRDTMCAGKLVKL